MRAVSKIGAVILILIFGGTAIMAGFLAYNFAKVTYPVHCYHPVVTTTPVTTTVPPTQVTKNLLPYNPSTHTVYLYISTWDNATVYNFNGTSGGELHLYIPAGWTVDVVYTNYEPIDHNFIIVKNSTATPSCSIIPAKEILLFAGVTSSDYFDSGVSSGGSATGSITLSPGYYWFACGYEDHAESGMWGVIECSSSITQPYYEVTNEETEDEEEEQEEE
ncbi:sulfocyanin-like copper-binding protein [Acidianus sp. HS-5]|uniref:sulfocyanin-like copper-binding protein n=1 Tax=Acidianus sp. HS-5 TaxID=2886040 RepID=UPI001F3CB2D5|nr:sulfocyanin-like copper-binding protein [Acidianus sp. HS-5]BDC17774.1 sulfocyanin [Acidianus sp. HS-5]